MPSVRFFAGAYVVAVFVDLMIPSLFFGGLNDHRLLLGIPHSLASFVAPILLFLVGFSGRRFELAALPVLAVPLIAAFAETVRQTPPVWAESFQPIDQVLVDVVQDTLPFAMLAVFLGIVAGRRLLIGSSKPERWELPGTKPLGIAFVAFLIVETFNVWAIQPGRTWFDFPGQGVFYELVSLGLTLSFFALVFALNSGWAVVPTLALPAASTVMLFVDNTDVDWSWSSMPTNIMYFLLAVGTLVLPILALSAWCHECQPNESDGPNAISSTRLPAGSET